MTAPASAPLISSPSFSAPIFWSPYETDPATALPYPGDEPAQLTALHERILDARQALAYSYDLLQDTCSALSVAWYGDEADTATAETTSLISVCEQAVRCTDVAAGAVSDHLITLYRIRARVDALRDEWTPLALARSDLASSPFALNQYCTVHTDPSVPLDAPRLGIRLASCQQRDLARTELMGILESRITDVLDRWRVQVQQAEESADACRRLLLGQSTGGTLQGPGLTDRSVTLAQVLGTDDLVFDDRVRARFGRGSWDALSDTQRAYYLTLAQAEFGTDPVCAGPALTAAWLGLDPMCRQALLHDNPARWGNTDGIPAADRDQANRIVLAADVTSIRARAAGVQPPLPASDQDPAAHPDTVTSTLLAAGYTKEQALAARGTLAVAYQLRRAADGMPGGGPVQLLIFDPAAYQGRGRAAIALSDVATADNVAMLVPGMTSQVPDYLDNQVGNALNMVQAVSQDGLPDTAAVAYVGYDAPDMDLDVAHQEFSDAGAQVVATDVRALRLMRTDTPGHLTVIAHSYGSTTTATAFAQDGAGVGPGTTDLVLIGSPGAGRADTAADLDLPGHVWVGSASSDPVTTVVQQAQDPAGRLSVGCEGGAKAGQKAGSVLSPAGQVAAMAVGCAGGASVLSKAGWQIRPELGADPAGEPFGAVRFAAETHSDSHWEFGNHSLYYDRGSESLANILRIATGDYSDVTTVDPRPESGTHYGGHDPASSHVPPEHAPGS